MKGKDEKQSQKGTKVWPSYSDSARAQWLCCVFKFSSINM